MRIDAALHRILDTFYSPTERPKIKALLEKLNYKLKWGYVAAGEIKGSGTIDHKMLVLTRDMIGFGWPMRKSIWMRISN